MGHLSILELRGRLNFGSMIKLCVCLSLPNQSFYKRYAGSGVATIRVSIQNGITKQAQSLYQFLEYVTFPLPLSSNVKCKCKIIKFNVCFSHVKVAISDAPIEQGEKPWEQRGKCLQSCLIIFIFWNVFGVISEVRLDFWGILDAPPCNIGSINPSVYGGLLVLWKSGSL